MYNGRWYNQFCDGVIALKNYKDINRFKRNFKDMSIKINQEIWIYVERLYIHCYGVAKFKLFLKRYGIEYISEVYKDFNNDAPSNQKPFYLFMSEVNRDFANFMQTIPSYKYIPILQEVVYDECIRNTRTDNWNYYGVAIRNWHPKIVELLKSANVTFDIKNKKVIVEQQDEYFEGPDFLPYVFNDLFLDYIRKEINETYKNGQLLACIILSRKLLEVLIIRIFEVFFPKKTGGKYEESNHSLWFDKNRSQYHNFEQLLLNLKENSGEFHEDKELVEDVYSAIQKIRKSVNKYAHRDYKIPNDGVLKDLDIESVVVLVRKVYKKYCNP